MIPSWPSEGWAMMPLDRTVEGARFWVVSASEGEPLGGVEVRAVGEGELGLVADSCRGGVVEQVGLIAPFAGVLEIDPRRPEGMSRA
jgi:hypothetical protein